MYHHNSITSHQNDVFGTYLRPFSPQYPNAFYNNNNLYLTANNPIRSIPPSLHHHPQHCKRKDEKPLVDVFNCTESVLSFSNQVNELLRYKCQPDGSTTNDESYSLPNVDNDLLKATKWRSDWLHSDVTKNPNDSYSSVSKHRTPMSYQSRRYYDQQQCWYNAFSTSDDRAGATDQERKKKTVVEQIAERVLKRLIRLVCEEVDEGNMKHSIGISTEDDKDMEFSRMCALLTKWAPFFNSIHRQY